MFINQMEKRKCKWKEKKTYYTHRLLTDKGRFNSFLTYYLDRYSMFMLYLCWFGYF